MRKYILTSFLLFTSIIVLGQTNDPWFLYWNKDSSLFGFKDKNGVVKIEPKFTGVGNVVVFENIIVVTEEINGAMNSYFLTKTGKVAGRDSIHVFDNTEDCENEGFIRFHDQKTDKAGMFNRNGEVAIPAVYNDLTRVRNGMIAALTGAQKKTMGEHFSWEGGRQLLIDTNNNMLIDSFSYEGHLNFYSVLITDQPNNDPIRQNFRGANGQYYSFIDFEKEFRSWLQSSLPDHLTKTRLLNSSYKKLSIWKEPDGWISEAKNSFMDRNFELIKTKLLALKAKECDYHISYEDLNPYIFESDEFKRYFNSCGESKDWIYPVMNIVISYKDNKHLIQDHFGFLRTDNGYKLLSISIKKGKLR